MGTKEFVLDESLLELEKENNGNDLSSFTGIYSVRKTVKLKISTIKDVLNYPMGVCT